MCTIFILQQSVRFFFRAPASLPLSADATPDSVANPTPWGAVAAASRLWQIIAPGYHHPRRPGRIIPPTGGHDSARNMAHGIFSCHYPIEPHSFEGGLSARYCSWYGHEFLLARPGADRWPAVHTQRSDGLSPYIIRLLNTFLSCIRPTAPYNTKKNQENVS